VGNAWERHATTVAPVWGVTTLPEPKAGNANNKIDWKVPWTENHHHAQGFSYHHSFTCIAVLVVVVATEMMKMVGQFLL
jgi:hypothetical protein